MNIVLDGFGGDLSPLEPLRGAAAAVRELGVTVTVTGDEKKLADCAAENRIPLDGITFADAPLVIPVSADPTSILKEYAASSMAVGLKLVAEGKGDALVSAGSTGALLVGATFVVKRIRGVRRPALGTLIPMKGRKFYFLIDAGANHDCRAEMLAQFAVMGAAYCEQIMGVKRPRVGLANIGVEPEKGTELQRQAYGLLSSAEFLNFVGNAEAREIPNDFCDVVVCDGFTGNIILKLTEGFSRFFNGALRDVFYTNALTKAAALAVKKPFGDFKKSLDYKEYGGAPLLGIARPVIKAHGSSDARAFKNAVRQAKFCIERDVAGEIERGVRSLKTAVKEEDA